MDLILSNLFFGIKFGILILWSLEFVYAGITNQSMWVSLQDEVELWIEPSELLAQNKAADEFTVLFLITQDPKASIKPEKNPNQPPAQSRRDPRPSLLHSWKHTWAVGISENYWLLLLFWVFSAHGNHKFYLLLSVWPWTWDVKCWSKLGWWRHLCMATMLSREICQAWVLELTFTSLWCLNTWLIWPNIFWEIFLSSLFMGMLKQNWYKMCCETFVCNSEVPNLSQKATPRNFSCFPCQISTFCTGGRA